MYVCIYMRRTYHLSTSLSSRDKAIIVLPRNTGGSSDMYGSLSRASVCITFTVMTDRACLTGKNVILWRQTGSKVAGMVGVRSTVSSRRTSAKQLDKAAPVHGPICVCVCVLCMCVFMYACIVHVIGNMCKAVGYVTSDLFVLVCVSVCVRKSAEYVQMCYTRMYI
jgi:hypothetical protein